MATQADSDAESLTVWGWENYFSEVARFIETSERQLQAHANQHYAEYVLDRLSMISQTVSGIKEQLEIERNPGQLPDDAVATLLLSLGELLDLLPQLARKWEEHSRIIELSSLSSRYHLEMQYSTQRGRPAFQILQDQLDYLRSLSFSWSDISRMLGVSRMTIYRRRIEYGMVFEPSQSISDSQLMQIICEARQELPDIGQSMLAGRLRAMGVRVTRERVREAVRRSDPLNTALRWHDLTVRRPYSVPGPNSLWHIGILFFFLF